MSISDNELTGVDNWLLLRQGSDPDQATISGNIVDGEEMCVDVEEGTYEECQETNLGEPSCDIVDVTFPDDINVGDDFDLIADVEWDDVGEGGDFMFDFYETDPDQESVDVSDYCTSPTRVESGSEEIACKDIEALEEGEVRFIIRGFYDFLKFCEFITDRMTIEE